MDVELNNMDTKEKNPNSDFIDKALQDILSWEKLILNLKDENDVLTNKLKCTEVELSGLNDRLASSESIRDVLHENIEIYTKKMQSSLDDKDEIDKLQNCVNELRQQLEKAEDNLIKGKKDAEVRIETLETEHSQKLQVYKNEALAEGNKKVGSIQSKYNELQANLNREKENNLLEKRAYETKLVQIQMENDGKLAMMQAQNSRMHTKNNNPMQNSNDIFRRKLQHVKEEHLKEVSYLKHEIEVMKQKLANASNRSSGSIYNIPKPISGTKRPGILKRKAQD